MKKTLVLDTNVILHDSSCIYQFEDNDVVLPISVLEELDHFKKGNDVLNFHAREFVRALDSLSGDKLFNGGVRIGPGSGKIMLKLDQKAADMAYKIGISSCTDVSGFGFVGHLNNILETTQKINHEL